MEKGGYSKMDRAVALQIEKPLSIADQSIQERGSNQYLKFNTNTVEILKLPLKGNWRKNVFNLTLATKLATLIKAQRNLSFSFIGTNGYLDIKKNKWQKLHISASDFFYISYFANICTYSRKFEYNKDFEVSLKDISILMFGSDKQQYIKRTKKIVEILSLLEFDDSTSVLVYKKRNGLTPIIRFNESALFSNLKNKNDDFISISKRYDPLLSQLIKYPKAFCFFLEAYWVCQKEYLDKQTRQDNEWLPNRQEESDKRLKCILSPQKTHSVKELKNVGKKYIDNILQKDCLEFIQTIATTAISSKELSLFHQKKELNKQQRKINHQYA